MLHRIVADSFIKNEKNLKEINHIDGDKKNNKIENLEWCTRIANVYHFFYTNKRNNTQAKSVIQYDLNGNKIKEYESIRKASQETKINAHNIIYCCKGQKPTACDYIWKYKIS